MTESKCLHCPRISPNGQQLDDEYDGPDADDDETPRKHVETTSAEEETTGDERSYPLPLPSISQSQKSARSKPASSSIPSTNIANNAKAPAKAVVKTSPVSAAAAPSPQQQQQSVVRSDGESAATD